MDELGEIGNQQVELDKLAYSVGFILGDGSLFVTAKGARITDFGCSDEECVERSLLSIFDVFGSGHFYSTLDKRGNYQVRGMRTTRKDVFDWFYFNTVGKTEIPRYYFGASIEVQKELLAGLWDSDGCVSFSKNGERNQYRAEFVNKKLQLVEGAATLLRKLGVRVGAITTMEKVGYANTYKIRPNITDFAQRMRLYCKRKQGRLDAYLESSETRCIGPFMDAEL